MNRIAAMLIFFCSLTAFASAGSLPDIKFEKYTLPNGLSVILHEDHSLPVVSVNVWYHVGSRNEKPGRTGFAHLFEHMMFEGSKNWPGEYTFEDIGGDDNATTSEDRTSYYENLPSNYLERALWMEADRMGFLLPAMTQQKLDNQRDVVKNERREDLDNQPYNKIYDFYPSFLYPAGHPYSWPVIGSMSDLSAATLEDVSDFFRNYYTPNNASLCVAGDFDPAQTKQWVEKYFASLPAGPPVDRIQSWNPELDGVKRAILRDNVNLPRVYFAWFTPARYQPGDAEFGLLANILASGKTSRLYKSLVYEDQIAQDVDAQQSSSELNSIFIIDVTAREGHTLEEIEKAVDDELNRILQTGVTPMELSNAQNEYEAGFVRSLELAGGFGGRADKLNEYNVFLGTPGSFQWDLDRFTKATSSSLLNEVKRYLSLNRRAIIHVIPNSELSSAAGTIDRTAQPTPGSEPAFVPPVIQQAALSNGAPVYLVENHKLPLVQISIAFKGGWAADPADRPGSASLTAELLDEGTTTRTALQISDELKAIGAVLGSSGNQDASSISLNVLKKNLDSGLTLMSDILLNPTFPAEELERQRNIYLGRIAQEEKEPFTTAFKQFLTALYGPGHPYGQPYTGSGTESSIRAIQRQDLVSYYKQNYVPNNAGILIAGDVTLDEARTKLTKALANWKQSPVQQHPIPNPPALTKTRILIVDKPGAEQTVLIIGNPGIRRNDPDYEKLEVLNNALGGQYTSRINLNLREDKGYTYGAASFFMSTRGVGAFVAYAPVQTQNTKEALAELVQEVRDVTGRRPLTADEIKKSKDNLIKSYPQSFETLSSIAGEISEIFQYDLPLDDWKQYVAKIESVTPEAAAAAGKAHITPDALLIVAVGDRAKIESGIRELGLGDVDVMKH